MTDPYVAEIRAFAFPFAPLGWAVCAGQLLPIAQHTALFSLVGTMYGGDGKTTFALPNLSDGRVPIGAGAGPGLTPREVGDKGGAPTVSLQESELPLHQHPLNATTSPADVSSPTVTTAIARSTGASGYAAPATGMDQLDRFVVAPEGNGAPHDNLMPYLAVTYCIALQGVYPARP